MIKKEIAVYTLAIILGTIGWIFITSHGALFGVLSVSLIIIGIVIHHAATNKCPGCKKIMNCESVKQEGDHVIIKFVCPVCGKAKLLRKPYIKSKFYLGLSSRQRSKKHHGFSGGF